MKRFAMLAAVAASLAAAAACAQRPHGAASAADRTTLSDSKRSDTDMADKVVKTDAEWKRELTPEQYQVLRHGGTERAFTGKYWNEHDRGLYRCAACGEPLFSSDTKYDSGSGWPSFYQPVDPADVRLETDRTLGMPRTEVLCARCGGHLGHVFDDGPEPTGLRYCINSAALALDTTRTGTGAPAKGEDEATGTTGADGPGKSR